MGQGGVRELDVSQSKTRLKCWVYCLLCRNHLLCTAEHNNRDWLCVAWKSNNCSPGWDNVQAFIFLKGTVAAKNCNSWVTWKSLYSSKVSEARKTETQPQLWNTVYNYHNGWDLAQWLTSKSWMASCCALLITWGLFSVATDSPGKQIMASFQKHGGSTKCLRMRESARCCENHSVSLPDAVIKVSNSWKRRMGVVMLKRGAERAK